MSEERRQPRNMQGLLHFCTELTVREDAPNTPSVSAMDPARREFLQDVMASMTMNVAKQMANDLKTIDTSENIQEANADTEAEEAALDDLLEIVQDVDNAYDFVKMGGYPVLLSCVNCPHPSVSELACEVLGVVCQNNPKCQDALLTTPALSTFLQVLDSNAALDVRVKALYAASCLVRSHLPAQTEFEKLDGFSHLMRAMQTGSDKLFIKAVFLIAHLIDDYQPTLAHLLSMGYTELLVGHLCSDGSEDQLASVTWSQCREHCTSALLKLCSSSAEARQECSSNTALIEQLNSRLQTVRGGEEYQEETDFINALLRLLEEAPSRPQDESEASDCR